MYTVKCNLTCCKSYVTIFTTINTMTDCFTVFALLAGCSNFLCAVKAPLERRVRAESGDIIMHILRRPHSALTDFLCAV